MEGLKRWRGRVAMVTGASSGIGEAIARGFAGAGLKTVITARRKDRLDALVKELTAQGGEVLAVQADMSKAPDIKAAFAAAQKTWGTVDVLVNNAGHGSRRPISEVSAELWKETLDVNVYGLAVATQEALCIMKDKEEAQIINIGSIYGHQNRVPLFAMYAASKHAVNAFTNTLRTELQAEKSKIRVGVISPGMVATEMRGKLTNGEMSYESYWDLFHPLLPQDIADAALYMLSTPPYAEVHDVMIGPMGQAL